MKKFKMAAKSVEKILACFISKINTFYAEIQDAAKRGGKRFWQKDFKMAAKSGAEAVSKISSKSL